MKRYCTVFYGHNQQAAYLNVTKVHSTLEEAKADVAKYEPRYDGLHYVALVDEDEARVGMRVHSSDAELV